MSARGHAPPPGMMRHGPPPGVSSLHPLGPLPPELMEKEVRAQAADIDRLVAENRRLAASQVAMRQDLVTFQEEIHRRRAHARSTHTETDIQIRALLDKIAKMEADVKEGESVKKNLEQAHKEAQSLVAARQELTLKIQQVSLELENCRNDAQMIPDMLSELDSMRLEHQKMRSTFEQEKRINLDLVEQMQAMERNLMGMGREIERLRAEVVNAEKRVQAPQPGTFPNVDSPHPPSTQGNGFYDPYGRAHIQMGMSAANEGMVPHSTSYSVGRGL